MVRISAYEFGRIVVDGETHTRDVVIHPGRVEGPWWRREGHRLHAEDLAEVWASTPETLVVGTGYYGRMIVPQEIIDAVQAKGIEILTARTPDAVATFNRLSASGRKVVGALHLTC